MLLLRPSISEVSRFHCFRNVSINFQTSEDQFIEELAKRFPLLSQKELYQGLSFFLNLLSRFSWNIEYSCRTYLKSLITNIRLNIIYSDTIWFFSAWWQNLCAIYLSLCKCFLHKEWHFLLRAISKIGYWIFLFTKYGIYSQNCSTFSCLSFLFFLFSNLKFDFQSLVYAVSFS